MSATTTVITVDIEPDDFMRRELERFLETSLTWLTFLDKIHTWKEKQVYIATHLQRPCVILVHRVTLANPALPIAAIVTLLTDGLPTIIQCNLRWDEQKEVSYLSEGQKSEGIPAFEYIS